MQQIGANDGYKWKEGNLAAGFMPNGLGSCQRLQGGGQIKKRGRERKHTVMEANQVYTACRCKVNPAILPCVRKQLKSVVYLSAKFVM